MLLRQENARLTNLAGSPVQLDMAVQCCGFQDVDRWNSDLPGVENHRWPLISSEAMDFFGSYGFNAFHMRLGPFYGDAAHENLWADVGGPYVGGPGSAFNPAFFSKVEEYVSFAAQKGWWVEINVVDTWYCKHAQWGDQEMPWTTEAVQSCGRTPNAEVEAFIRQVVRSFTKYGNVIWLTDNEGDQIQGDTRAWFEWVRDVIRNEESLHPSGHVHLIGTNSAYPDIADYAVTHARAALTAPIAGRWTLNNERNPAFSPEQEASNFAQARALGLSYAYWRAEQTTAQLLETLERFKEVMQGGAPVGCFPPASDDPLWVSPPSPGGGLSVEVREAIDQGKQEVGERCGTDHEGSLQTIESLGSNLRLKGWCAGRLDDALFIKDGEFWKEIHVVTFASGCWSLDPGNYPKNTWTYSGTSIACPAPTPPPLDHWIVKVHNIGPNWTTVDATAKVHNAEYCAVYGFGVDCPVRPEGDPTREICERQVVGIPQWTGPGEVDPSNPYLYRVRRGTGGTVTVCGKGGVCGSVEVQP